MNQALAVNAVRSRRDLEAVKGLCIECLTWNRARYAHLEWLIERYYDVSNWAAYLSRLSDLYAPPSGDILLARLGDDAVGCVMMHGVETRVCEMKHLFVDARARGHGVGFRLCNGLMMLAAQRGFEVMRLETGIENKEAIALYLHLGFGPLPSPKSPDDVQALLRYMSIDLTTWAHGSHQQPS
jgi:GNAT superfamily N-acetyltransferase